MYIYVIKNILTNKRYVGKSIDVNKRCWEHYNAAYNPNNNQYNSPFQCAIRKYGKENFLLEHIYEFPELTEAELYLKEIEYIEKFNTFIRSENSQGYNATLGGEGGQSCLPLYMDAYDSITHNQIEEKITPTELSNKYNLSLRFLRYHYRGIYKTCKGMIIVNHKSTPVFDGIKGRAITTNIIQNNIVNLPIIIPDYLKKYNIYHHITKQLIEKDLTIYEISEKYKTSISSVKQHLNKNRKLFNRKYIICEINIIPKFQIDELPYKIDVYDKHTLKFIKSYKTNVECYTDLNIREESVVGSLCGRYPSAEGYVIQNFGNDPPIKKLKEYKYNIYDAKTLEYIKSYCTIEECANDLNIHSGRLMNLLGGRCNQTAGIIIKKI